MSTKVNAETYNEVALLILDDQGQVEVAELVAQGNYARVLQILVVHADRLCDSEELSVSERNGIFEQLGLSLQEVEEMRNGGEYIGIRGILNQESDEWVFTTCRAVTGDNAQQALVPDSSRLSEDVIRRLFRAMDTPGTSTRNLAEAQRLG